MNNFKEIILVDRAIIDNLLLPIPVIWCFEIHVRSWDQGSFEDYFNIMCVCESVCARVWSCVCVCFCVGKHCWAIIYLISHCLDGEITNNKQTNEQTDGNIIFCSHLHIKSVRLTLSYLQCINKVTFWLIKRKHFFLKHVN